MLNHQDQNLGNWQVKRQVGSNAPIIFKFPVKFTLKAGQRVTVSTTLFLHTDDDHSDGHSHTNLNLLVPVVRLTDLGLWCWWDPQSSH